MLGRVTGLVAFIGLSCSYISAQDKVGIHVWDQMGANVGHVALSTGKSYISLWPEEAIAPRQGVFDSSAIALPNYEADCQEEGRDADSNYVLLLDTAPIDVFWASLRAGSFDLGDGKIKLDDSVRWFGPSGTNIQPSVKGAMNLNCASTVVLALKSCEMEGIDHLMQQLSQSATATSLDVRGSIETVLDDGKDQVQRLMEFSNLGLMYLATIKPGDVSDFIQKYIYAKTRTNIETIIMEGELFSLNLAGTRIAAQDVIKYLAEQFENGDKEDRSSVRSTQWLLETHFLKFGNYTSDVATHKRVYHLSSETKKEIEESIKRREVLLTVAGAVVAGSIAYLLTPEEDPPIVVPAAALLGGVATNAMVKR